MSLETIWENEKITYTYDQDGTRRAWTQYELAQKEIQKELKDFLRYSSLTDEDMQRLRGISADYNSICAQLPEDDKDTRRTVLDTLLCDIPEASEVDATGLRRLSSSLHGSTVIVDGHPMPVNELEIAYTLIQPSTEVLDRAVNDASYFYVPEYYDGQKSTDYSPSVHSSVVAHAVEVRQAIEVRLMNDENDTLAEEIDVEQSRRFGGGVLAIANR